MDDSDLCIVTNYVAGDGNVSYAVCEESSAKFGGSGWRFYGYDEDYWNDPDNYTLYSIHGLAERFPEIVPLIHSDVGTGYYREKNGEFISDDLS